LIPHDPTSWKVCLPCLIDPPHTSTQIKSQSYRLVPASQSCTTSRGNCSRACSSRLHGALANGRHGRPSAEATGRVGQPIREQGADRAQSQGPQLRVRRGGPHEQERAPPRLQPGAQEGARAHPRRQARPGVTGHRAIHR
jgi:hypothetical protein